AGEQRRVATELVDDKPRDQLTQLGLEQLHGADERREDASPLDVGDEQHRCPDRPGNAHVDDVRFQEVHLDGTARSLDYHEVEGLHQLVQARLDHRPEFWNASVVFGGVHAGEHTALHDHL